MYTSYYEVSIHIHACMRVVWFACISTFHMFTTMYVYIRMYVCMYVYIPVKGHQRNDPKHDLKLMKRHQYEQYMVHLDLELKI